MHAVVGLAESPASGQLPHTALDAIVAETMGEIGPVQHAAIITQLLGSLDDDNDGMVSSEEFDHAFQSEMYGTFDINIGVGPSGLGHFPRASRPCATTQHAVRHALLGAHLYWVLIGACNPMSCPIHCTSSGVRTGRSSSATRARCCLRSTSSFARRRRDTIRSTHRSRSSVSFAADVP